MKAAIYSEQGPAAEVLKLLEIKEIKPLEDEVQIEIHYSGVNLGEVKKRADTFGVGMPYDRIIPHSDGAGYICRVGRNVDEIWVGKKVLCFGAQSYRQFGTAAEYCCVPLSNVVEIADNVDLKQAAQMGIPGVTAHRSIHVGGSEIRQDRTAQIVLIQGGSGAVGQCAIAMAKKAGAEVIATVRKEADMEISVSAGADKVFMADGELKKNVLSAYPDGVDHIVEVAFAANIETDVAILKQGGTIATFASNQNLARIPFWPLVFSNISIHFLGSDDFSDAAKQAAARDLAISLAEGWPGLEIGRVYELEETHKAHLHIEDKKPGRALIKVR